MEKIWLGVALSFAVMMVLKDKDPFVRESKDYSGRNDHGAEV